jgi:hypothetical protein
MTKEKVNYLGDYYQSLPEAVYPKTEFINKVALKCNVSAATVRNWVCGMKPRNKKHIDILSEMTGIPADKLFV